jgi:hypothetical protein
LCPVGAVVTLEEEIAEDFFRVEMKEIMTGPESFNSTLTGVHIPQGSCSCGVRLNHTYLLFGNLQGKSPLITVTSKEEPRTIWDIATVNTTHIRQECNGPP